MLLASLRARMDFQYYGFIGFNSRVQRQRFPATRPSQRRGLRPRTEGQRTNCTVGPPETAERAVIKLQPAVLERSPAQLKAATFRRWLVGGLVGWLVGADGCFPVPACCVHETEEWERTKEQSP